MTIPWNIIDKVLEGKRLNFTDVKTLYRTYYKMLTVIGLEGSRLASSSIVLSGTDRTRLSMVEAQKLCLVLNRMEDALRKLDKEDPDLFLIWDKAVLHRKHYLDIGAEMNIQSKTSDATKMKIGRKIDKATDLIINFLQG